MSNALDSPTVISSSTRSLQKSIRSRFLIHTCTSTSPVRIGMGHLSPVLSSSPSSSSAAQTLALHNHYKTVLRLVLLSSTRETSLLYRESLCLWHSCFQPVQPLLQLHLLPLHARSFLGHKLPLLSSYNLNFPFTGSNAFGSSSIKPLWAMLLQFLLLFGLLAILVLTFISRDSRKG